MDKKNGFLDDQFKEVSRMNCYMRNKFCAHSKTRFFTCLCVTAVDITKSSLTEFWSHKIFIMTYFSK